MADSPTFIHVDKAIALWVGSDGIPSIIYPDRNDAGVVAQFDIEGAAIKASSYTVTTTEKLSTLFYTRSRQEKFDYIYDPGLFRAPCFYVNSNGDAITIEEAKYPRVFVNNNSGTIYLTYWTNLAPDGSSFGEPVDATGAVQDGYTRVLYFTVGTPQVMTYTPDITAPSTTIKEVFYVFSEPEQILQPIQWDNTGGVEPVVDTVSGGSGAAVWLADPL